MGVVRYLWIGRIFRRESSVLAASNPTDSVSDVKESTTPHVCVIVCLSFCRLCCCCCCCCATLVRLRVGRGVNVDEKRGSKTTLFKPFMISCCSLSIYFYVCLWLSSKYWWCSIKILNVRCGASADLCQLKKSIGQKQNMETNATLRVPFCFHWFYFILFLFLFPCRFAA